MYTSGIMHIVTKIDELNIFKAKIYPNMANKKKKKINLQNSYEKRPLWHLKKPQLLGCN